MKQLGMMNFASLTEKSSKIQHKAVSQKSRKIYGSKTCNSRDVSLFRNTVYKRNFNFFQYLPLVNGRKP